MKRALGMSKIWKTFVRLNGPTVSASQNIIVVDSSDESEISNGALVPTSAELRNILKSRCSHLDAHSNDGMNNKMDDF
ncbi:hypothetical protein TNCV_2552441 [Trichonephila clavipes]|nr:hypothetical protein TNCV_2552441 [Trichonephila clavipes]